MRLGVLLLHVSGATFAPVPVLSGGSGAARRAFEPEFAVWIRAGGDAATCEIPIDILREETMSRWKMKLQMKKEKRTQTASRSRNHKNKKVGSWW